MIFGFVDSAVVQQSSYNGADEEILNNINELIINRTGMNVEIVLGGNLCFVHSKFQQQSFSADY